MKVVLGILIGVLIVKLIRHRRWRHMGFGHGCGPFGHFGRRRRLFWMLGQLELDPRQKDELSAVWLSLRQAIGKAQTHRWRTMTDVVEVATAEPLDRARLDEAAARHGEAYAEAAREAAAAIARAHEALRPEQRAKLRELVERAGLWRFPRGEGTPPSEGPYR